MIGGRSALLAAAGGGNPYGNWTGNYSDVSLLLRNGTPSGLLILLDESPTPKAITTVGSVGISTTTLKYGSSSIGPGSIGSYLLISDTANNFDLGGFNATLETWVYTQAAGARQVIAVKRGAGADNWNLSNGNLFQLVISASNAIEFTFNNGGGATTISGGSISLDSWHHVAVVTTSSNDIFLFVNGIIVANAVNAISKPTDRARFIIGSNLGTFNFFSSLGFIDDLRITKGIARYTSNFTPPTAELPANITDDPSYNSVSLLLRNGTPSGLLILLDESPAPKTITTVGSVGISTTTLKYGSSSIGPGSIGSYLLISDTANNFDLGGFNATLETWVYTQVTGARQVIAVKRGAGADDWNLSNGNLFQLVISASNAIEFTFNNGGGIAGATTISGGSISLNSWHHVAVVTTSSNNIFLFVNGIIVANAVNAISKPTDRARFVIGSNLGTFNFFSSLGFIDDLRITKGFARYTKNFLPPPAELPAI